MNRTATLELAAAARRFADLLEQSVGSAVTQDADRDLSVADVAGRLGRSASSVREWCERGLFAGAFHLPSRGKPDRRGRPRMGAWRIPASAVEAFRHRADGQQELGAWRKQRTKQAAA